MIKKENYPKEFQEFLLQFKKEDDCSIISHKIKLFMI